MIQASFCYQIYLINSYASGFCAIPQKFGSLSCIDFPRIYDGFCSDNWRHRDGCKLMNDGSPPLCLTVRHSAYLSPGIVDVFTSQMSSIS